MVCFARPGLVLSLLWLCCSVLSPRVAAQDPITIVERLYMGAAYEEALAALDKFQLTSVAAAEYRILCLLTLGQVDLADSAIEKLVVESPHHRLEPSRFAPKHVVHFDKVRRRVLSAVVASKYRQGRTDFEAKAYTNAIVHFVQLLDLLKEVEQTPQMRDLASLATGFVDLAKATIAEPSQGLVTQPARTAANDERDSAAPASVLDVRSVDVKTSRSSAFTPPTVFDASSTDVTPPVPMQPIVPPSSPDLLVSPSSGLLEIIVNERGYVESAAVHRSVSAAYDALLLQQCRTWRFKPATRNSQPVKFRKVIEIYMAQFPSLHG